ncbi:MAG: transposase [Sphingobacteriales bacterium]|nr:MAG: transposase [Sphingobacteriales bacterium]TAF44410.1 MAG: transposase [Sphingobacteriales bacterium]TAF80458.1 MAG: transposase [Sphingobacteriales bacterium]
MKTGEIYFFTATINKWQRLLWKDDYKNIVVNCLKYLSEAGLIDVFAFVIMPNHIHLIWRINAFNGKETAQGSFLKYTAHAFKKMLKAESADDLTKYAVNASNKSYEFWQRDSLAIHLYTREVAYQKLDYIHNNPMGKHWNLVTHPNDYVYSSAKYYETGETHFSFLKDLRNEF